MDTVQFHANENKRKEAVATLRRHSPLHKVFCAMAVVAVCWLVASFFLMDAAIPAGQSVGPAEYGTAYIRIPVVGCMTLLFGGVPLILILRARKRLVDDTVNARHGELLLLTEAGVENTYSYKVYQDHREDYRWRSCCSVMLYQDIERIELYEQEQALKVYGKVYFCKGPGSLQKENVVRVLDKPSQAYRVFFLYYHDSDRFVQLLAERAGKPVDRMNVCTTSLQEVKNKGVF